jgi:hypothetical protein
MPLRRAGTVPNTDASLPGSTRQSIFFEILAKRMDARVKPAHDENWYSLRPRLCSAPRREEPRDALRPGNKGR